MSELPRLYPLLYEELIRRALQEDLGRAGDLTTDAIVAWGSRATAHVVARAAGTVAGLEPALHAVCLLDPEAELELHAPDGTEVEREDLLAVVRGSARALLSTERTALNLLGRLSGIATATRGIVRLIEGTGARVVCTRKTTPGLRTLEKHAVRAGGGMNHRFGLDDGVLIKDNHRALAGGIRPAIERVHAAVGHMVKVEVEVDTLEELAEALELGVDAVLLDNMSVDQLREAVSMARGRALTEASGGITPQTARAIAETGVDLLSLGWLTHSSPALDVALDVQL
ncbi:MAG: carboxylating nicotinate-nucleotide diphosphorylase [Longimicrobiaceae bacterium]